MKIWKPDTCQCEVEEVYNGNEIVGGGQILKKCAAHADVADNELYGVLYANPDGENKRKNLVYRTLLGLDDVKGLGLENVKKKPDGTDDTIELKEGITYDWSFEGTGKNRKLKVQVKGANLTGQQKQAIKNSCDNRFGQNKVEVL